MNKKIFFIATFLVLFGCGKKDGDLPDVCVDFIKFYVEKSSSPDFGEKLANKLSEEMGGQRFDDRMTPQLGYLFIQSALDDFALGRINLDDPGSTNDKIATVKKLYAAYYEGVEKQSGKNNAELAKEDVAKKCEHKVRVLKDF
ncbi:hypothetical protein [uncultured Cardiobacterium sp.]|uniref:hypothetical protein n=1 Tax=uncultured Cardiobacterium sp. TaxID=417619 RepID=UPI002630CC20|nr:hypothetical protein [uncultured Cardiobacterium sp.]